MYTTHHMINLTSNMTTSFKTLIISTTFLPCSPNRDKNRANIIEKVTIPKTFIPSLDPSLTVLIVLVALWQSSAIALMSSFAAVQFVNVSLF